MKSRLFALFLAVPLSLCAMNSSVRADEPATPAAPLTPLNLPGVAIMKGTFKRDPQTGKCTDIRVTGASRFKIKKVTLMPGMGDETGMRAFLTIDDFTAEEEATLVIKVKDKLFVPIGYGGDKDRYWSLSVYNVDAESGAILNGGTMDAPPKESLQIEFSPYMKSYKVGEKVQVGLSILNVGKEPLKIFYATDGGSNYHCRDLRFTFTAKRDGKTVAANAKLFPDGFVSSPFVIKPNSFLKRSINVDEWLQFDQPGTYEIDALYTVDITNPKAEGQPEEWAVTYPAHFKVEVTQ